MRPILIACFLFLVACGGSAPGPSPTPQPVLIIVVTATAIPPTATIAPTIAPTPTAAPKGPSALFTAQATRFIELGSKIVSTAKEGTLPTYKAQVGEMKSILGLLKDTGGDLFSASARAKAQAALDYWGEAVTSWERLNTVSSAIGSSNGHTGFKERDYMDLAERSFEAAKAELIALLK